MNRRKFASSVIGAMGMTCIAPTSLAFSSRQSLPYETGQRMISDDGHTMTINRRELATANKDHKQFIVTFQVHSESAVLSEKIYRLTDQYGKRHHIYMKPIAKNRLQAEFNWRTHA